MDERKQRLLLVSCVLFLIALPLAVFYQVQNHEFINYDDEIYVVENPHVTNGLSWEGIRWAFGDAHAAFWHPLTWASHMLDCELFGLNPKGHHLTNVFLHVASTIVLFLILTQMTRQLRPSVLVAALFAVHPLHVESVAWVAERKDVLSTLFWMLAMGAYVLYARNPGWKRYMGIVLFFVLGLMSKPMLVTLPFVFLLLDFWPLRRFAGFPPPAPFLTEKAPLILLAAIFSAIAYVAQQKTGSIPSLDMIPMIQRVANAIVSAAAYIEKMFWPTGLVVFYPHPGSTLTFGQITGSGILLLVLAGFSIRHAKKIPYLLVGFFWYLITLLPVIGLIQVGNHGMADRYTYVPLIGLFLIVAWGITDLESKWPRLGPSMWILALMAVLILSAVCWRQVRHWKNTITLFEHVLRVTPRSSVAHSVLGMKLQKDGDLEGAINHYATSLAINPASAKVHYNMAMAMDQIGMKDEALEHYTQAVRYRPDSDRVHNNLGDVLARMGRTDEAIHHYREALRIKPDQHSAHNNLANALAEKGQMDEAISHYLEAIRISPRFIAAHYNLSKAYALRGNWDKAVREAATALTLAEATGDTNMIEMLRKRLVAYRTSAEGFGD